MPRYFFNLDGAKPFLDKEGVELPDDEAAWREAKLFARDIESNLRPGEMWYLEVHERDRPIYQLRVCSRRCG
jgi:hypothetical protein